MLHDLNNVIICFFIEVMVIIRLYSVIRPIYSSKN